MFALETPPRDGVWFGVFGVRAAALGLRPTDVFVGLDNWRVRNLRQYEAIASLSHDPVMLLTVWRDGRHQQLRVRIPERTLASALRDYPGEQLRNP